MAMKKKGNRTGGKIRRMSMVVQQVARKNVKDQKVKLWFPTLKKQKLAI